MKKNDILTLTFAILCVGISVIFGVPEILPLKGDLGRLIADIIPRFSVTLVLIVLMGTKGYGSIFRAEWRGWHILWSIPCFAVAIVNFPFSALIKGVAVIEYPNLIWLFTLKCVSIALLEEVFFRGLLLSVAMDRFKKNQNTIVLSVIVTSLLFALMHIINLAFGAGLGATALQVGYTFLIGCMLAVMFLKTQNLWLCVIVHTVFDIGGTIVTDLGKGAFQDATFWILTIVAGIVCAIHIMLSLRKLRYAFETTNKEE